MLLCLDWMGGWTGGRVDGWMDAYSTEELETIVPPGQTSC